MLHWTILSSCSNYQQWKQYSFWQRFVASVDLIEWLKIWRLYSMEGSHLMSWKGKIKENVLMMSLEATGPGVQHEGFDVDEKISLLDFPGFSFCWLITFTIKSTIFDLLHEILHRLFNYLTGHFPNFDGLQHL